MTHIVTRLCLRDTACVEVCPVECMVLGFPEEEWPWLYIDPDTCIDCGACVPECPYEAIFPEDEVPDAYVARGGEVISMPASSGLSGMHEATNHHGTTVVLKHTRVVEAGETLDLTEDIQPNFDFFTDGPGYDTMEGGPDAYEE